MILPPVLCHLIKEYSTTLEIGKYEQIPSYYGNTSVRFQEKDLNLIEDNFQGIGTYRPNLKDKKQNMVPVILGSAGILLGFMGVVINLYILLILVLHKKTRSSTEWIILHLSSCGLGTSSAILCLVAPSIISTNWKEFFLPIHEFIGTFIMVLQLLTVWSICALRCSAIISPLRYTQLITRKRILFYFIFVWTISVATILFVLSLSLLHKTNQHYTNLLTIKSTPNNLPTNSTDIPNHSKPEAMDFTLLVNEQTSDKLGSDYETAQESPYFNAQSSLVRLEYHSPMGFSLPKIYELNWISGAWLMEWICVLVVGPTVVLLVCDLIVLSIARRQRHRIVMALYQITLSAQATVTRNKGTPPPPPNYWLSNRSVPPKSRACRAVWEDLGGLICINFPSILITLFNLFPPNYTPPPDFLYYLCAVSLFLGPIFNALLYGVRARPLRTAVKSYLRKRLTNNTLQQEIQQRLSPVDGSLSPRASTRSRFKSFRSYTNSPNSSGSITPTRRLSVSTNDLRPPPFNNFPQNRHIRTSPSQGEIGANNNSNRNRTKKTIKKQVSVLRTGSQKVRSFLQLPTAIPIHSEFQELWSGLRKAQRSPTIVITHEIRLRETETQSPTHVNNSLNSLFSSSSISLPSGNIWDDLYEHNTLNVEHMV